MGEPGSRQLFWEAAAAPGAVLPTAARPGHAENTSRLLPDRPGSGASGSPGRCPGPEGCRCLGGDSAAQTNQTLTLSPVLQFWSDRLTWCLPGTAPSEPWLRGAGPGSTQITERHRGRGEPPWGLASGIAPSSTVCSPQAAGPGQRAARAQGPVRAAFCLKPEPRNPPRQAEASRLGHNSL